METKHYIGIGGWYAFHYPAAWCEDFSDDEETALFHNPNKWSGNFRISAFEERSVRHAKALLFDDLKEPFAIKKRLGNYEWVHWMITTTEQGIGYTTYFWSTVQGKCYTVCSYTTLSEMTSALGEEIVATVELRERNKTYPRAIIPLRLMEQEMLNAATELLSDKLKKVLKKEFKLCEADIPNLQRLYDEGIFTPDEEAFLNPIGVGLGMILENQIEGMQWATMVNDTTRAYHDERPAEEAVLRYGDTELFFDAMHPKFVASMAQLLEQKVDLQAEYEAVLQKLETLL